MYLSMYIFCTFQKKKNITIFVDFFDGRQIVDVVVGENRFTNDVLW